MALLLKFDTILGRLDADVSSTDTTINVGDQEIAAFAERDPGNLKWGDIGADVIVESTGFFTDATKAHAHIDAGAKKVIISAPASNEDITDRDGRQPRAATTRRRTTVISNASCTTNCLAPMAKAPSMTASASFFKGLMTTIHAYTPRTPRPSGRTRASDLMDHAAALNIVPTSTDAAKAIGLVLPAG